MNWKVWFKGLAAAAIGGTVSGASAWAAAALQSPAPFNSKVLLTVTVAGAIIGVAGYFAKSPFFNEKVVK